MMMNNTKRHLTTHYAKPHQKDNERRRRCTRMNVADKHRTMHEDKQGQVPNDAERSQTTPNDA
jgi:hypothetical protein